MDHMDPFQFGFNSQFADKPNCSQDKVRYESFKITHDNRLPMISTSSLVLDGHHAHGLGPGPGAGPGGPHHMAFVEPYLRGKLPVSVPEFLRPLPKPAPLVPRYGGRPPPSQSPRKDFSNGPTAPVSVAGPVNLTSVKHDVDDSQISRTSGSMQMSHMPSPAYSPRLFPHPGFYPSLQNPYPGLYPSPYQILNRPTYINSTPMSPLERQYSPPDTPAASTPNSPAFLPPTVSYSSQSAPPPGPPHPPPAPVKPGQSLLREKRPFKVPVSGKDSKRGVASKVSSVNTSKRATNVNNNNNNLLPPNFTKGSLIQLGNGDLRRVEDVTTEDLVLSAERCPAFRLDPSTVVRIEESSSGAVLLTLSYGEQRKTVEIESTQEHPYFVFGQGWASCSPERTLNLYGLQCHRLQVGDVCISLSPRPSNTVTTNQRSNNQKHAQNSSKADTLRPPHRTSPNSKPEDSKHSEENGVAHDKGDIGDEGKGSKRRRYSAPDRFEAEDEYIDPGSPSPLKCIKE